MKFFLPPLLVLLLGAGGCHHKDSGSLLSGMTYASRDRFFDSLANKASAGLTIDSINRLNADKLQNEITAHTALAAIIHAPDRYDPADDKLAFLVAASEKAKRKNWKELYADMLQQLANYTWITIADKNKALQYYHRAYQVYKGFNANEFPDKLNFLFDYAGAYFSFEEYDKAMSLYAEAVALGDKGNDKGIFISTQNTIGLCHRIRGEYEQALKMFNKALQSAEKHKDSTWITIVKGNIGTIWHLLNKPEQAKPLLMDEVTRGTTRNDWKSASSAQLCLAEIELNAGNTTAALYRLRKARQYSSNTKQEKGSKILKRIFDHLALAYRTTGDYKQALLYTDSAKIVNDSIQKKLGANILLKAQNEINQASFTADREITERINRYTRNSLIAGILLLGIISAWFIITQRKKYTRKQKQVQAEKEQIARDLQFATEELTRFARSLEEKNGIIEKIEQLQTAKQDAEEKYGILSALEKSVLLTDEQWTNFTKLFEKAHGSFLLRLKEKAPGLSPAEIRIIALSKLKLSNKTMAGMLGITPDAVRMNKHRIRKKLNLEEEAELEKFLASV